MIFMLRAIIGLFISALLGLIPFFVGWYLRKRNWGIMGLVIAAGGGMLVSIPFGWLWGAFIGLGVAIAFTIVCFVSKTDLNGNRPVPGGGPSQQVAGPPPAYYNQPQSGSLSVVCIAGPLSGQIYRVGANGITIGRETDCVIRFPQNVKGVSRHHCCIRWDGSVPVLVDLNSSYGTFLSSGRQLMPNNPVPVNEGTVFYLGSTNYMFRVSY